MRIAAEDRGKGDNTKSRRATGSRILLGFLLTLIGSVGFIGSGVQASRAGELRLASDTGAENFRVSALKNYSTTAARISQESLPSGYDVGSNANAFTIAMPIARPASERPDLIHMLRAQAACVASGMFDACPGFQDLLHGRPQAWPRFPDAALPDAGAPETTGSIPEAKLASADAGPDMTESDVVAVVDRLGSRAGEVIIGAASTYNPYDANDNDAGGAETASGELYNPIGWTAAIQIDLRDKFAGVRYGRLYKPSFALVELNGKRAIVKINDVGPLRPGRVIDLSTQAMHYFDPSLERGVLDGMLVTPLVGSGWTPGPLGPTPTPKPALMVAGI